MHIILQLLCKYLAGHSADDITNLAAGMPVFKLVVAKVHLPIDMT